MKTSINIEFTDDEILKFAENGVRRLVVNVVRDFVADARINPDMVMMVLQAVGAHVNRKERQASPEHAEETVDPEVIPSGREHDVDGLSRCASVGASLHLEEGWICHVCGAYNVVARKACRGCQHERCDPAPEPP